MAKVYPVQTLRTLAIHTQHLTAPISQPQDTSRDGIANLVEKIGCIQLDTLQMVHRAQYIGLWSRLGHYNLADLDSLAYQPHDHPTNDRRLFEYWYHAACLIPFKTYRYITPEFHEKPDSGYSRWLAERGNEAVVQQVKARVQQAGRVRQGDFEDKKEQPGGWWNWKPTKIALEYLYDRGELMIADRPKFQRVYDVRERVIPAWVDQTIPSRDEMVRHFLETAVKAFGVCQPKQASNYYKRINLTIARPYVEAMIKEGVFVEIQGEFIDGKTASLIVHRDNLSLLEQIEDGAIRAERTTFLTAFDNLLWAHDRDEQLWGFYQKLEAYTRPHERKWGYFCLPILHRDRLIGRFDVKMERKTATLRLFALYLEPAIPLTEELVHDVAEAFRHFMEFHGATTLVIDKSDPKEFGKQLLKAIKI